MRSGWAGGNAKHRPPFALVLFLDIDWDETNKQHQLKCQLLTADGDPVVVPGPHGPQRILLKPPPRRAAPWRNPRHLGSHAAHPQHSCGNSLGTRNLRVARGGRRLRAGHGGRSIYRGRRGPPAGVMRVGLIAEILTATTTFTILTHPIAAVGTCCC